MNKEFAIMDKVKFEGEKPMGFFGGDYLVAALCL